jgi:hypothetical protein
VAETAADSDVGAERQDASSVVQVCNPVCNGLPEDEQALEDKMLDADLAGDRTRADAYKRRLERLREAKALGLIVLATERERRR